MRSNKLVLEKIKPRNLVAKDLLTPKYRMRVAKSKKAYNRQSEKLMTRKDF